MKLVQVGFRRDHVEQNRGILWGFEGVLQPEGKRVELAEGPKRRAFLVVERREHRLYARKHPLHPFRLKAKALWVRGLEPSDEFAVYGAPGLEVMTEHAGVVRCYVMEAEA